MSSTPAVDIMIISGKIYQYLTDHGYYIHTSRNSIDPDHDGIQHILKVLNPPRKFRYCACISPKEEVIREPPLVGYTDMIININADDFRTKDDPIEAAVEHAKNMFRSYGVV